MPNNFNFPFVLSVIGAFIASAVVARLYVWPALQSLPRCSALRILASLHAFRSLGMNFIVVGFVSPALNSAVGQPNSVGRFRRRGSGALFNSGAHMALGVCHSDRMDLQSLGHGRSLERLLQGCHSSSRRRIVRRRNLHSSPLCPDTRHRPHARLHGAPEA
jgi:uncharacterized membrane protein YoaK (UPF0700 family)